MIDKHKLSKIVIRVVVENLKYGYEYDIEKRYYGNIRKLKIKVRPIRDSFTIVAPGL